MSYNFISAENQAVTTPALVNVYIPGRGGGYSRKDPTVNSDNGNARLGENKTPGHKWTEIDISFDKHVCVARREASGKSHKQVREGGKWADLLLIRPQAQKQMS